jgi:hypothetical protein
MCVDCVLASSRIAQVDPDDELLPEEVLSQMGSVDNMLFTLNHGNDFLLVQIYVDDIIFGCSSYMLVSRFQEMMEKEF